MRLPVLFMLLSVSTVTSSGCAVVMATRAPEKKDMSVLTPGVSRSRVIAELGMPAESRDTAIGHTDLFSFDQGYAMGSRVSRSMMHGLLDLNTLCLWELVGTPLETSLQGEPVRAEVVYDGSERVQSIEYFSGAHLANGGATLAPWMRKKGTVQTAIIGNKPQAPSFQQNDVMPASAETTNGRVSASQAAYSDEYRNPVQK